MSRTWRAEAILSAKDAMGPGLRSAANRLRRFQQQAERASRIGGRAAPYARGMELGIGGGAMLATAARFAGPAAAAAGVAVATRSSLSLERTMYDVQKATNASGEELKGYEKTVLDMARSTGKTKEEIGGILAAAGYAGRPINELVRFTEYATQATTAWGTSADVTGQSLAEIGNIYQANQKRIEEIGDAVNHVADNAAAKETDLLDFLRRSGATGRQMGLSAEQTMAFGAAMKEIGTPTEVAATGFNALMNAMALGDAFTDKAADGFKRLGINSKKMQKDFAAKPLETTLGFLERLSKVKDPLKRAQITTEIFGKEYGDDIARMTGNLDGLRRILGLVADKANYLGSVSKGYDIIKEKDFQKLKEAEQALDVLATRAGNAFKLIAGDAAEGINSLVDSMERARVAADDVDRLRKKADEERKKQLGDDHQGPWWKRIFQDAPEVSQDAKDRKTLEDLKADKPIVEQIGIGRGNYLIKDKTLSLKELMKSDNPEVRLLASQKYLEQQRAKTEAERVYQLQKQADVATHLNEELSRSVDSPTGRNTYRARTLLSQQYDFNARSIDAEARRIAEEVRLFPDANGAIGERGALGRAAMKTPPAVVPLPPPRPQEVEAKVHNTVEIKLDNNMLRAEIRSVVKEEVGPIRTQSTGSAGGLNTGRSMPEAGGS